MLMRILRALMLLAGLAGVIACTWALLDPSIMANATGRLPEPPSPRWRAAFGLLFSLLILGWGAGVLRHRELP
ncbi:MAG: hypothetical protein Q4F49_01965 [Pseudoxanthomonas suwonensis]|nr:hypothetical protein [Pseudoxanthomonas suwonensis]